jgi:5'-nucleotidase
MLQWYKNANMLLAESGVQAAWFPRMVAASNCELRDSTDLLLNTLEGKNVPFIILSAGIGDLIKEILAHFKLEHGNIKIVSNFLDFDPESGAVRRLKGDPIHMFNKKAPSQKGLEARKNVILIGDSLGDIKMADGIEEVNVVLSIGFLNKNVEGNLSEYKRCFDVVLVDDQTMDFPLAVVGDILANSAT